MPEYAMRAIDLAGQKFGRLTVLKFAGNVGSKRHWLCRCDCGNETSVNTDFLRRGLTKSCGCYRVDFTISKNTSHGLSHSRTYKIWAGMKKRCLNPSSTRWKWYGGRGIKVCKRWLNFENFHADMGDPPSKLHSIERVDNSAGYEPGNCIWTTQKQQVANQRKRIGAHCSLDHVRGSNGRCKTCHMLRTRARRSKAKVV